MNGLQSDSLLALMPADQAVGDDARPVSRWASTAAGWTAASTIRMAGWKGRGIYATYGADAAWHIEGGPVEPGNLVRFQIRPDPLAR